jgi:hypothetical protein
MSDATVNSYMTRVTDWHESRDRVEALGRTQAEPAPRADLPENRVRVEQARRRQTGPEPSTFRDVLAGTTEVLMSGAAIAARVMGAPALAAAVAGASVSAGASIASSSGGGGPGPEGALAAAAGTAVAGGAPGSELATMAAMQRESQMFNLQLLELQEQVQQENRRFTTLSNVMRAKHDTAKAAVSNIRS